MGSPFLFDIGFAPIQKPLNLSIPYIGHKNMICPQILQVIAKYQPNARFGFDLFGGGGSVSLAMVASGLTTNYNELKHDMPQIYEYILECIRNPRNSWGIFDKEFYEVLTRAEFYRLYDLWKRNEPMSVRDMMWRYTGSFNCKGTTHYTDEFKGKFGDAGHILVMYPYLQLGDPDKAIDYFVEHLAGTLNNDPSIIRRFLKDTITVPQLTKLGIYERRLLFRSILHVMEAMCVMQTIGECKDWSIQRLYAYSQSKLLDQAITTRPDLIAPTAVTLAELKGWAQVYQLSALDRLEGFESIKTLKAQLRTHPLTITNKSYADFDLKQEAERLGATPDEVVVFNDIPYLSTPKMNSQVYADCSDEGGFNAKAYIDWVREQNKNGFNIFLTEYHSPDPDLFKEIAAWQKISATTKDESVRTEKLFLAKALK